MKNQIHVIEEELKATAPRKLQIRNRKRAWTFRFILGTSLISLVLSVPLTYFIMNIYDRIQRAPASDTLLGNPTLTLIDSLYLPVAINVITYGFGLVAVVLLYERRRQSRLVQMGSPVRATVHNVQNHGAHQCLLLTYATNNQSYEDIPIWVERQEFQSGDQITILVDPENPESFVIYSRGIYQVAA